MMAPPSMSEKDDENVDKNSGRATASGLACEVTSKVKTVVDEKMKSTTSSGIPSEKGGAASEAMFRENVSSSSATNAATSTATKIEHLPKSPEAGVRGLTRAQSFPTQRKLDGLATTQHSSQNSFKTEVKTSPAMQLKLEKKSSTSSLQSVDKNNANSDSNVSGRWTAAEHEAFLAGLKIYGREWKKVANCIPTRTSAQIRSHAQKYFAKVSKESQRQKLMVGENRCASCPSHTSTSSPNDGISLLQSGRSMSSSFLEMARDPLVLEMRVSKTLSSLRERYHQLQVGLKQIQSSSSSTYYSPPLEGQQGDLATKITPEQMGSAATTSTYVGPATAALALEQKSLRQAAKARYEMKKLKRQSEKRTEVPTVPEVNQSECAQVSVGDFDAGEVLALSVLGGTLGRPSASSNSTLPSQAKTDFHPTQQETSSSRSLDEGQQHDIDYARPSKLRKTNSNES